MLVFGDARRRRAARAVIAELREALRALPGTLAAGAALDRHAAIVGVFVDASELAQGLADAEVARLGREARGPHGDGALRLLVALARAIASSWDTGTAWRPDLARLLAPLDALDALDGLDVELELREAEGYAYYALYPEAYLLAARAARPPAGGERRVIGIRSIGAGLAALVAVGHDAPLPSTVRPAGDPFRRELRPDPALVAEWLAEPRATLAIVDEGPGLSGSSFGAVLDVLDGGGVPLERIECYPSHGNELGPSASAPHRARWRRVRRHPATAEPVLAHLPAWIAARLGPLDGPLEELSAGAWRAHRYACEAEWPAAVTHLERRKLLARAAGQTWLARFVGLGRHGEHALERARALHAAGFTPEVAGLCHGFLVERWHGESRGLDRAAGIDRRHLVARVGGYLAFRARAFPAAADRGASLATLAAMIRRNAGLALGDHALGGLARFTPARLEGRVRRIEIDGRLHAWEWLVEGDRVLKADAVDHHAAHDLIGCQDVAWDLAGAELELGLPAAELAAVAGHALDPELHAFLRLAYLAFQLGRCTLALDAVAPAEATRLRAEVARYGDHLRAALG